MTALHDSGRLSCPRCGEACDDLEVPDAELTGDGDDELRVALDCPGGGAPLELVMAGAPPEALGVDVWLEDRRDAEE